MLLTLRSSLYQPPVCTGAGCGTRSTATNTLISGCTIGAPDTVTARALTIVGRCTGSVPRERRHAGRWVRRSNRRPDQRLDRRGSFAGQLLDHGERDASDSNDNPFTGHTVYQINPRASLTRVARMSGAMCSATVKGRSGGRRYHFQVSASKDVGNGLSSAVSAAGSPRLGLPAAPTGVDDRGLVTTTEARSRCSRGDGEESVDGVRHPPRDRLLPSRARGDLRFQRIGHEQWLAEDSRHGARLRVPARSGRSQFQ